MKSKCIVNNIQHVFLWSCCSVAFSRSQTIMTQVKKKKKTLPQRSLPKKHYLRNMNMNINSCFVNGQHQFDWMTNKL